MTRAHWSGPRRVAHRGGGSLAPENTLVALRVGLAHGYRAVEFDVMLTADDVAVLMHDPTFGRTVAGRGRVAETAYADLAARDAGSWFDLRYAGEPVPRYGDVADFCATHGVWMNVEIKPSPGSEERTGRVVGELTATFSRARTAVLFSSFSPDALDTARAAAPDVPRGLLVDRLAADTLDLARSLGCVSVHLDQRRIDRDVVERIHAAGFAVLAYTVNTAARAAQLDEAGVDALFTDRIDLIPFA